MRDARLIWKQYAIPVIFCRSRGPALVKFPWMPYAKEWLRDGRRARPKWMPSFRAWQIPRAWTESVGRLLLTAFGEFYLIHPYREQEKCAPACWNAIGLICECSCVGQNHGSGKPPGAWHEVSETFAFCYGEAQYSCRLITAKSG